MIAHLKLFLFQITLSPNNRIIISFEISVTNRLYLLEHILNNSINLSISCGVSVASISNWVHAYREKCQTNDYEKTQLELMEEVHKLRQ